MTDFKPKLGWQTENYRCVQVGPCVLWVQVYALERDWEYPVYVTTCPGSVQWNKSHY